MNDIVASEDALERSQAFTTPTRTQLREDAAAYIREMIVAGQAKPGELLRLSPLAEQVGASITPIREALLSLAQDGWVVQEPNRGFRVASIKRADIEDIYLVHQYVAGELTARAAERSVPDVIDRLRSIDTAINQLGMRDGLRHEQLNFAFHSAVYEIADAPRLAWFVDSALRFVPRPSRLTIPGWFEENSTGHAPIIDAIEAREPETARVLMQEHILRASQLLLDLLDHQRPASGDS